MPDPLTIDLASVLTAYSVCALWSSVNDDGKTTFWTNSVASGRADVSGDYREMIANYYASNPSGVLRLDGYRQIGEATGLDNIAIGPEAFTRLGKNR